MAFSSLATPSSSRFSKFLMKKWNNKLDTLTIYFIIIFLLTPPLRTI